MRSAWGNVAARVYETDVAQGVSRYNTDLIGPEDPEGPKTTPAKTPEKFEEDEEDYRTGWKPLSLSTPMLAAVIALTLLIAGAIETLAQRSKSQGGLALSTTADDIPGYAEFGYLYVPTVAAVLYSMLWSWIDLDAKRMQPWFELSKPRGAAAANSMFLDYQYDFVGFVPFRAAKKKHWPVFFSGITMIVVLWILTPLQSSLLGTGSIAQARSVDVTARSQLVPMADQVDLLDPEFLNTGYAIAWLGQPYPSFTTSEYALLPYYLENDSPTSESNWTTTTTKLSTELNCWPAEVEKSGPSSATSYNFLNGQGCNFTAYFSYTPKDTMLYIGYSSSAYSDYALAGPNCPKTENSSHQFLAIWSRGHKVDEESSISFNITALYCQPTYYAQKVRATVDSASLVPGEIVELEPRELLSESAFNSTAFEFVLANGMAENKIIRDFPFNLLVEQQPRLNYTGFSRPVSNMVGFAVAGDNLLSEAYSNVERLQKSYTRAHKYLFAIAAHSLLTNDTSASNLADTEATASVEFYLYGILVSRVFASILEGFLFLVIIFTSLLIWFCRTAPSKLGMNPTSLGRHIDVFRNSPELLCSFRSMDTADEDLLRKEFEKDHVKMMCGDRHQYPNFQIVRDSKSKQEESTKPTSYKPALPLALKRESGALLVVSLIAAIVSLSYLKKQEQVMIGLPRPSNNFEVLQILENYIPTIFATLIEPFWILLNRLICVLQPFRDLWQGQAKASSTIDALYTSIPPQLVLFRALKSRHFMLMLLCIVALLANLLAIGLGSLFNELPTTANYIETSSPVFAPRFDNTSIYNIPQTLRDTLISTPIYQDPMYVMLANFSTGTTLPPWVSKDYFFQKYELSGMSKGYSSKTTYTLQTRGFGANSNCTPTASFELPIQNTTISLKQCRTAAQALSVDVRNNMYNRPQSGSGAVEYMGVLNREYGREHCDYKPLLVGWSRTNNVTDVNATVDTSLLTCHPIFETAMFNLTVDSQGHVLSYNRTTELESTLNYTEANNHIDELLSQIGYQLGNNYNWHNNTLSQDWINYLMVLKMNSRAILDPEAATPDPNEMAPLIKDLYARNFALFVSLNLQLFDDDEPGARIQIMLHTPETRIFMENASFIITIAVLCLNVVTALVFYARPMGFVLPRMPTTLGSIVAYTASSRFANRSHKKVLGERTYSFGWFTGVDGKEHLGIEMDPHVTRVDSASLFQKPGMLHRLRSRWFSSSTAETNRTRNDTL